MLKKHEFVRSHGLGNDYLVVDGAAFSVPLSPANIRRICDRHSGVGSDGILELVPPPEGFDAAVRILNPDGSEAEKSGNGVRIFAKFCIDHGYADAAKELRIHTLGGAVRASVVARTPDGTRLHVDMGKASFRRKDLPMLGAQECVDEPLTVGDREFRVVCVSMGNPHVVVLDAPFTRETAMHYGPLIENHELFPKRTNVQFIRVKDRGCVEALIWERGAGWTMASGSSACAVAAACVRTGRTDRSVDVSMPGGILQVSVEESWEIYQTGQAQEIAIGRLSADLLSDLEGVE